MVEPEDLELSEEDEEIGLRAQEVGVQQIRSRVASRAISEAREVELFRERLQERLLGGCMFCYPLGMADSNPDHMGIDCSMARTGSDLPRKIAEGKPARFDRVKGKTIGIWSLLPISAFNIHMLLILFIICQHLSYTYPQV
jgi:hypothetical protein